MGDLLVNFLRQPRARKKYAEKARGKEWPLPDWEGAALHK